MPSVWSSPCALTSLHLNLSPPSIIHPHRRLVATMDASHDGGHPPANNDTEYCPSRNSQAAAAFDGHDLSTHRTAENSGFGSMSGQGQLDGINHGHGSASAGHLQTKTPPPPLDEPFWQSPLPDALLFQPPTNLLSDWLLEQNYQLPSQPQPMEPFASGTNTLSRGPPNSFNAYGLPLDPPGHDSYDTYASGPSSHYFMSQNTMEPVVFPGPPTSPWGNNDLSQSTSAQ